MTFFLLWVFSLGRNREETAIKECSEACICLCVKTREAGEFLLFILEC